MDLNGRKVVVLGLGDTGLSMARWLTRRKAQVWVADSRAAPPHASTLAREMPQVKLAAGAFTEKTFSGADLIAISPGIDRRETVIAGAAKRGVPLAGDVELFAQALPGSRARGARVLAVTGSNGKSTVTAMAGEMCRTAGRKTVVAGNIGVPVLDALTAIEEAGNVPDVFVLELSSFQLESTSSLAPDAATVLNISEDHLDRYDGLTDYAAAKARVFTGNGVQVLNRDDQLTLDMARAGRALRTFGHGTPRGESEWGIASDGARALAHGTRRLMAVDELPLAGLHNATNALAAHALVNAIGLPDEPLARALREFRGLPHRMQKVADFAGVAFFDDSKGTNVGATVAALRGMDRAAVLIAGGDGKGQDFGPLAPAVKEKARAVVLIGRDAVLIEKALAGSDVVPIHAIDMDEAVVAAFGAARPGDAVLLSPACASYDMFRDYVQRAEVFAAAVRNLERKRT